jgi:glycosyltransferase involved in cell wall biosynthesis
MRLAFFGHPHAGGTWTVFRNLKNRLAERGIELVWIGRGRATAEALLSEPQFRPFASCGFGVGDEMRDDAGEARAMAEALAASGADGVIVNVAADRLQTNLVRYLPERFLRVMIVHNITIGTYAAAAAVRDHVHATVGVSPRIRDDLVRRRGFPAERTFAVMTGIEAGPKPHRRPLMPGGPLRLISLGRVEEAAKGILVLPRIVERVPETTLTVAGDGPDLDRLKDACAGLGGRVRFLGRVAYGEVARVFSEHDVMLMPSRYEGQGLALLEAMSAGCVPVASRIRGVTDATVADGENGFLFPPGDVAAAARVLERMRDDLALRARAGAAAARTVRERFTPEATADAYAAILSNLDRRRPAIAAPIAFSDWSFPPGLRDGWRTRIPAPIKNLLRTARERFAG